MNVAYKFRTDSEYYFRTNIKDRTFENEWIELLPNGVITISKGYAWNGCSPKIEVLDLIIGTPDGRSSRTDYKPLTFRASMVHDAIYQFKEVIPITRKEADEVFDDELFRASFFWRKLYVFFVRAFGGTYGNWLIK